MLTPRYFKQVVTKNMTLKEFLFKVDEKYPDAFEKGWICAIVNGKSSSLKATLKSGDEVIVFPVIAGGFLPMRVLDLEKLVVI